ncbi:MAG: UbiH/UbiF/VisC/COQ6 family ubiquinone biosynthesis hydroxylase [Pseudomonadota bacterium]
MAERTSHDVVIVGGGMVGAALAAALATHDFRVAVVERREPQRHWPRDEIANRVSALSRASQMILQALGAWPRMQQLRVTPYREMRVWDIPGQGDIHFDSAGIGEPDLGHIVENRVTQLALWEILEQLTAIDLYCPASVADWDYSSRSLRLDSGQQLSADLLVAADGARSPLREAMDIAVDATDYRQVAVATTVTTTKGHHQTAWQRFLPGGPLAFLPVDENNRCSIVWSTTTDHAGQLLALDDPDFAAALTEASQERLGSVLSATPREGFPLRGQHARVYVKPGFALVGDAAHVIHPLAGQGVNLGFLDAATLAELLVTARRKQRSVGGISLLRRYERARRGDNLAMLKAMESFNRLFSNTSPGLRLVRNIGLAGADRLPPLKNLFMRRALGLTGQPPALARISRT